MRRVAFAGLCLALAILFAGLGIWQVERRAWKLDLIAKVEGRVHAAPSTLPPRDEWQGDNAYRRVRVTGTFLHDRETLVQALTALGGGWWVLTPLQTQDGIILVNRGYVPDDRRDRATRQAALPTGPVTVTGLMRAPQEQGWFVPEDRPGRDNPAQGDWFTRDPVRIGASLGLERVAPFLIDEALIDGGPPWPRGRRW